MRHSDLSHRGTCPTRKSRVVRYRVKIPNPIVNENLQVLADLNIGRNRLGIRMASETAPSSDTATMSDATMSDENFVAMLEETFGEGNLSEGSVIKGTVIAIEGDSVLIDVGLNQGNLQRRSQRLLTDYRA